MLRTLWHPDGAIKISWYDGPFGGFVDGSIGMAGSPFNTKHLIGSPVPKFNVSRWSRFDLFSNPAGLQGRYPIMRVGDLAILDADDRVI
jgi:hypothetical protein